MSFASKRALAFAVLCLSCACAFGQDAGWAATADTVQAPEATTATASCCNLADGTPISLEIMDVINTMTIKRGDRFRIRLHAPVAVDGNVLIAAGAEGIGEVVHAEPGRASGKAAELILAARTLDARERQIKLRGMKYSQSGSNRTGMVAGVSLGIGVFAAFIHGGNIEIPTGTVVEAKIGETVHLPPLAPTIAAPPEQAGTQGSTGMDYDVQHSETTPAPPMPGVP